MLFFFFFNDTATTEIYTLSLHDALPISRTATDVRAQESGLATLVTTGPQAPDRRRRSNPNAPPSIRMPAPTADRKSTRLNSSHANISYAVFCLKKKKQSN